MILTEKYIQRLQELAGIVSEATNQEREDAFSKSGESVPFNKDMMIQAIKQGREMGMLFQSDNEKYKMPVAKYRIIYPVAIGLSKKGNLVVRAFHKLGQSEREALATGKRSAEVENKWRLFKVSGIRKIWFTGNFFRGPLESYNEAGDGSMVNIEVQANFNEIRKYQDEYIASIQDKQERLQKQKNIVKLFKDTGERPLEQPIQNPGQPKPEKENPLDNTQPPNEKPKRIR